MCVITQTKDRAYGALIFGFLYIYVIYVTNVCDSQKQHQNSNGLKRLFKTKRKREKDKGEVALVVPSTD